MAKHKDSKVSELDCEDIGCVPKLSQAEAEGGEGFWLHYEKISGAKTVKFSAKIVDTRIDFAEWVDGSKTKWQNRSFDSSQLAREEFNRLLMTKKAANFNYVGWKM